jgi:nitrile hydratase accessory protein
LSQPEVAAALASVAPLPADHDGPVFQEPWEAQAFAMAVALNERGVFTWSEWAGALADEIRRGSHDSYYLHWLTALEVLVAAKGVVSPETLADVKDRWDRAAHATPHGRPITLDNDPRRDVI